MQTFPDVCQRAQQQSKEAEQSTGGLILGTVATGNFYALLFCV